jgi:hypothetical protein
MKIAMEARPSEVRKLGGATVLIGDDVFHGKTARM